MSSVLVVLMTFLAAAGLCLLAASYMVTAVEDGSEIAVRGALDDGKHDWAEVQADGLRVILTGTAPDEARRFEAERTAGRVVDQARIINEMSVVPARDLTAPRFSVEILRNESGISIIGLIPTASDRDALIARIHDIGGPDRVTDLLETAAYPVPRGWEDALGFAVTALTRLPRSKISVDAGRINITAISDSAEAKRKLETELQRAAPPGLRVSLSIAAPRPVITPFTLRFLIDENGPRFDACSAESEASRDRILAAARAAGMSEDARCTIGLGVPSPDWAAAAELSLKALSDIGNGSVTFSDADIALVAAEGTDPSLFDRVIGTLESALPEVFALHAVLPVPPSAPGSGPPEFVATRSPEGLVQLRGRLSDENLRTMVDSYAKSQFGSDRVKTAARIVSDLPMDWPVRVLAGLESLSFLSYGAVTVTPDTLTVRGTSTREDASDAISRLLSERLSATSTFELEISYREPARPSDAAPDPDVCEAELAAAQTPTKIAFEPGSSTISESASGIMDKVAEILLRCGDIRLEIQGHTDSQGRTQMNQQLSQERAQSVLNELRARRVRTASYSAVGYGESLPIASNQTEEGREENRRIEFRLIRPEPISEKPTTLDVLAGQTPVDTPQTDQPTEDGAAETATEAGAEGSNN